MWIANSQCHRKKHFIFKNGWKRRGDGRKGIRERFIGTGAMYPRRCVDHDLGGVVSRPSMGHEGNATREDATTGAKISQGRTSRPCLA